MRKQKTKGGFHLEHWINIQS